MVVAATWNFQTIDPITSAAGGTVTIPNTVYNRLLALERGPDAPVSGAGVKGELAASWERSPDGLTFSFNMAEGVTWQNVAPLNGRAFVADDARYALERYATEGVHKSYYLNVAGFETVSDQVFNINMARPTADFLNPLGSNKQTIFPRELVDNGTIETAAVGTSAMILNEAIAGQSVTFDKNPDFWEREVLLDGFTFRLMPDAVARIAAFRVGQVDYAYSLTSNLRDLNKILETNPDIQINLTPVTYNGATLGLNLTLAKYQDERVRRAISLAINRPEIIDIVTDGLAKGLAVIPWTYLLDEEPTIESGVLGNWLRHDLDEAKKLLQAAGAEGLEMNNSYYPYSTAYTQTRHVRHDRWLAVSGQPPVAAIEPGLRAVGQHHGPARLALAALAELPADARRVAVVPGALHQDAAHVAVPCLRDRPPPLTGAAAVLARREPEVRHQLPGAAEARDVAELGQQRWSRRTSTRPAST